jgi:hypothetical protein
MEGGMASDPKHIDLVALRKITNAIFDHLIGEVGTERVAVESERDFYWDVPDDKLFAVSDPQPTLDVGRLSDDWEFLQGILMNKDEAVGLMLIHVAPLLRYVGNHVRR